MGYAISFFIGALLSFVTIGFVSGAKIQNLESDNFQLKVENHHLKQK